MKTRRSLMFAILVGSLATAIAVAQQIGPVLGKTNLQSWIDGAPGLPNNLDEAVGSKNSDVYQTFYAKVEAFKKSYKQSISSSVKPDEDSKRKAMEAQANSIPAIAQMGGIEKLQQMTPEQRAQAAQQMRQLLLQNPAALSAFTTPVVASSETAGTAAVQHDLVEMIQKRGTVEATFSSRDAEITNSSGSHREINDGAVAKLAKIPMVNDSVMGRVHDLEQEAALNKQTAARHRERAVWELGQRAALLSDQKVRLKDFVAAYQNWLKQNLTKINTATAQVGVAEYELSFIDAAVDLAKYSEAVTRDVASYQERSQQGTGAIRKTK